MSKPYPPPESWPEGARACTKCHEIKPLDAFHKEKGGFLGRRSMCKECRKSHQPKKKPQLPQSQSGHHYCSICLQEKPYTVKYFYEDTRNKSGLSGHCRVCGSERAREWRKNKIAEDPEYDKRRYWRHRDDNIRRNRRYYKENKEKVNESKRQNRRKKLEEYRRRDRRYYLANRKRLIERVRQWRKDNPERYRSYNQQWLEDNPATAAAMRKASDSRRRARKRNLDNDFTPDDWLYSLDYWNDCCAVCQKPDEAMHADHWIPLSNESCPGTVYDNMVPLCEKCNKTKHATDAGIWLAETHGAKFADDKLQEIQFYFEHMRRRKEGKL